MEGQRREKLNRPDIKNRPIGRNNQDYGGGEEKNAGHCCVLYADKTWHRRSEGSGQGEAKKKGADRTEGGRRRDEQTESGPAGEPGEQK